MIVPVMATGLTETQYRLHEVRIGSAHYSDAMMSDGVFCTYCTLYYTALFICRTLALG